MKEYFSHDYNARDDEKMPKLLSELGYEGYGIYWAVIEMLYKNDGYMQLDCKSIAFALHCDSICLDRVINEFDLFVLDDGKFYSESVLKRLGIRKNISEKRSYAAKIKWNANAEQKDSKSNAIKENKRKENKRKINTIIYTDDFLKFWEAYPKSTAKKKSFEAWQNQKDKPNIEMILAKLELQKRSDQWQKDHGQYIPMSTTYINQARWDDKMPEKRRPVVVL